MAISEQEAVASLRILVAVCQADGELQDEEKEALTHVLAGIKLQGLPTIEQLWATKVDVDAECKKISSDEGRLSAYQAAYSMAYADGTCTDDENKLLAKLHTGLDITEEKQTILGRMFNETRDTVLLGSIDAISDPAKRKAEIKEDVIKYSILSALLGLNPLPLVSIATDLAVVGLQTKMFLDIGAYYGHRLDRAAAKAFLGGLGVGTGARIAVNNLCKFIPGFGSAVAATTNFASTWALGKVAERYFEGGMKVDMNLLKIEFKNHEKDGKKAYEEQKSAIEAKKKTHDAQLKNLGEQVKNGKITQDEYTKKVAELA